MVPDLAPEGQGGQNSPKMHHELSGAIVRKYPLRCKFGEIIHSHESLAPTTTALPL